MRIAAALLLALLSLATPAFAARSAFTSAKSIDEVNERLAKIPDDKAFARKAALYSDLGTMLYKQGRMTEASNAFEQALTYRTNRELRRHITLYMGKSYESSGRLDKAIAAYEDALGYDPKNWRRHRDLAGLYEQALLFRKARDGYGRALELAPREPSLSFVYGRLTRKMGLYKESEPWFDKARDLGHDGNAIHRELSLVYEGRGQLAEALSEWHKGAGSSDVPEDLARTIYLSVLQGEKDGAGAALGRLKASGASPETVRLYENLIQLGSSAPEVQALVGSFLADRRTP